MERQESKTRMRGRERERVDIIIIFFPIIFRFLASLRGHVGQVYQITWSADSRLLCSGSSDSTLKVHNCCLMCVCVCDCRILVCINCVCVCIV